MPQVISREDKERERIACQLMTECQELGYKPHRYSKIANYPELLPLIELLRATQDERDRAVVYKMWETLRRRIEAEAEAYERREVQALEQAQWARNNIPMEQGKL